MLKSFPFYKWGVLCSERWSNSPKVTWLTVKREWKPVSVIQSLCSIYSLFCVRARQAVSLCPLRLLLPYWVDSEAPSSLTERLTYLTAFSISQANLTKQPDQNNQNNHHHNRKTQHSQSWTKGLLPQKLPLLSYPNPSRWHHHLPYWSFQ